MEEIKRKWLEVLCAEKRDTHLFVGDQHKRPDIAERTGLSRAAIYRAIEDGDLILEEVVDRGVPVRVYVLEDEPMPEDAELPAQLTLA